MSYQTEICPYCGEEREVRYIHRTKQDHMGYVVSEWEERDDDNGCRCLLGQLYLKNEKIHIKQMCCNCLYNKGGKCTNEDEKRSLSDMFSIYSDLNIKNENRKCKYYKLNPETVLCFVEEI